MSAQKCTFMNYELTVRQDALINYFIPSLASSVLYILLFASECALVFRHLKDENPEWAYVSMFIVFLPSLCSYVIIISSWDLWPEMEGCGWDNFLWFVIKTAEHLLFPVWAMWRFAERVFWSIEAIKSTDEKFISKAVKITVAPRTIELYFFFQAFLHSLPQMLLQLNILIQQDHWASKQTFDAEILSLAFNLVKLSSTVTYYQRFKSQKLIGKQYPWFKNDKINKEEVDTVILRSNNFNPPAQDRRRSSDFYLQSETDEPVTLRETSIVDGPLRQVYQETSEPDFNIRRVAAIKGLPDDDLAGKIVSFFWWSCFLIVRILAISAFFYFYPTSTLWILFAHFLLILSLLIYDVKSDEVKRAKALFFVFIALIYIFCIIEFKIRFKKAKFIYLVYFSLVFVQNFAMCIIWWSKNVEDLENDFWFRFIFIVVVMGTILSVTSMLLYLNIYKPKKVIVDYRVLNK